MTLSLKTLVPKTSATTLFLAFLFTSAINLSTLCLVGIRVPLSRNFSKRGRFQFLSCILASLPRFLYCEGTDIIHNKNRLWQWLSDRHVAGLSRADANTFLEV